MKQLLIIMAFISACFLRAESQGSNDDRGYIVKVGDMAPDFVMHLPSGDTVQLSKLKGKVVMLQFTASWCPVCRKEMPFIEKEIWQKHKNDDAFRLYGVDMNEPLEKLQLLAKQTGITYPLGFDPNANIFGLYAHKDAGVTRNVIVDKDGRIAFLTRLYEPEEFGAMVAKIDELLK